MSFVPNQSLSKLVCVNCERYLSHFPIYFHQEEGSICGRCAEPSKGNLVRNEVYENIAETQKFPCSHASDGCMENLVPSKIPQHEKHCSYKKFECPTLSCTNCTWLGFTKDLCDHFEQKHPTFFLKENQFELDFINCYKENCLLPFGGELFLINRSSSASSNTFSCKVTYIGINPKADEYIYKIILENEKKTHAHTITNKLNEVTEINLDGVRDVLNNPSSIIATVEILEHQGLLEEAPDQEDEDEKDNGVNYELMKELECLVCFEYMLPPIHQCMTGHSICFKCKEKVDRCPTCEEEFRNTQNFALAQIINYITYPCKNKKCKFAAKPKDIRQHEANCIFGIKRCPLNDYYDCKVKLIFSEIYDHVVNSHYENVLEMETVSLPFDKDRDVFEDEDDINDCYIIKYGFRLFKLHFKVTRKELFWAMQLIGSAEENEKYMFDVDIVDNSGKNQRAYFKSFCNPLTDVDDAFDDDKSFIYIDYNQIESMITKELTYRVRILHE